MNNKKLISKLSEIIKLLSELITELTNDSSNLVIFNDEIGAQITITESDRDRYNRLADLINNIILPSKITVENPRVSTSELITEIMKYPRYKPEKNVDIIAKINTLKQYLSKIKKRNLLSKSYKVERGKEKYYCKNEEIKDT